jgi:serine/threonine protein kinase
MRFEPNPNDTLSIFGERYVVQPHPCVPRIPYSSEAGRAVVYQLKDQKSEYFALKVFRPKFRSANLADLSQHLVRIENFEGLRAAHRRVVLPGAHIVEKFPDLKYAMLMPWISGTTWFDMLIKAKDHETYFSTAGAVKLCAQFLKVMAAIEQAGYAHADISQGNLIVGNQHPDVQLIDLEDMYMPGAPTPAEDYRGSPGYRHRSGDQGATTWCSEGDRYATAVMAAEMLLLTDRGAARLATDTGYFAGHCQDEDGKERFDLARGVLAKIAPEFTPLFEQAWFSDSLSDCPKIADLHKSLNEISSKTEIKITAPMLGPVTWKPWDGLHKGEAIHKDNSSQSNQRGQAAKPPRGYWEERPQPEKSVKLPPLTQQQSLLKTLAIVIAIVASIFFLLWIISGSNRGARNNFPQPAATLVNQRMQTPDAGALRINGIDGVWKFYADGHESTLMINKGFGRFESISLYLIDQSVTSVALPRKVKGILLKGENPVLAGTQIRPSNYVADEIFIQRQSDGSWKAWNRDIVGEWETLQVESFKPDFDWEESKGEYLTTKNIAGIWQFSNFSSKYPAALSFGQGQGIFRTQIAMKVTQQARAEITDQGILVSCSNPMLSEDAVEAPNFSPDRLFFQRQTDGSFKVWLKDDVNIKDWTTLKVISHP